MNSLAVCNTPFQIFNIINAIVNHVENLSEDSTDILIDMTFKNADKIGQQIINNNLCRNIYYVKKKNDYPKRSKIQCILDLIGCNYHEEFFDFSDSVVIKNQYDSIWIGDDNPLGLMAFRSNPDSHVFWYDDGTSSYSKSPLSYNHKAFYNFFAKLFKRGGYRIGSKILYLNNTDVVQYKGFDLRKFPSFDRSNLAIPFLNRIFDYLPEESKLEKYRVVILTQVLPASAAYKGIDINVIFSDDNMDFSNILIRKHPRDTLEYIGCEVDFGKNMWELECLNSISDHHLLIACCSTAQLTPKIIGDKEPYIFFLHRFLLGSGSTVIDGFENMIQKLVELYSDKSKVIIPDTVEEFNKKYKEILKKCSLVES